MKGKIYFLFKKQIELFAIFKKQDTKWKEIKKIIK